MEIATCLSTDALISLIRLTTTMTGWRYLAVVGNGIRSARSRKELLLGPNCSQNREVVWYISFTMPWTERRYFTSSNPYSVLLTFGALCLNHARYLSYHCTQYRFRRYCTLYSVRKRASHCRSGILSASGNFQQGRSLPSSLKPKLLGGSTLEYIFGKRIHLLTTHEGFWIPILQFQQYQIRRTSSGRPTLCSSNSTDHHQSNFKFRSTRRHLPSSYSTYVNCLFSEDHC